MITRALPATLGARFLAPFISVLFVGAASLGAETTLDSLVRYYNDNVTSVLSPHVRVGSTLNHDTVTIGAGYAMDIVTSSSTDVRSWSSHGTIHDTRREESVNAGLILENGSLSGAYVRSDENDYHSDTYSVSTTRDFFEKNTTVNLGVDSGFDHVGNSHDPSFNAPMQNMGISTGVTQVLSPLSIAQFLYDFRLETGYLAGSYRVARLAQGDGTVIGIPENMPDVRARNSFAFKYNYFFRKFLLSAATTLRYYFDTYGVQSATIEERFSRDFTKKFSVALNLRYYQQGQANFYKDKYDPGALPPFFTGNKTLAEYASALVGVRPTYVFHKNWEAYGKVEYYIDKFFDFTDVGDPTNPSDDKPYQINAVILGLGVSGKF